MILSSASITNMLTNEKNVSHQTEANSGLVKLVVMTNVFFNNQEHKIEIKQFHLREIDKV